MIFEALGTLFRGGMVYSALIWNVVKNFLLPKHRCRLIMPPIGSKSHTVRRHDDCRCICAMLGNAIFEAQKGNRALALKQITYCY